MGSTGLTDRLPAGEPSAGRPRLPVLSSSALSVLIEDVTFRGMKASLCGAGRQLGSQP